MNRRYAHIRSDSDFRGHDGGYRQCADCRRIDPDVRSLNGREPARRDAEPWRREPRNDMLDLDAGRATRGKGRYRRMPDGTEGIRRKLKEPATQEPDSAYLRIDENRLASERPRRCRMGRRSKIQALEFAVRARWRWRRWWCQRISNRARIRGRASERWRCGRTWCRCACTRSRRSTWISKRRRSEVRSCRRPSARGQTCRRGSQTVGGKNRWYCGDRGIDILRIEQRQALQIRPAHQHVPSTTAGIAKCLAKRKAEAVIIGEAGNQRISV